MRERCGSPSRGLAGGVGVSHGKRSAGDGNLDGGRQLNWTAAAAASATAAAAAAATAAAAADAAAAAAAAAAAMLYRIDDKSTTGQQFG